MHGAETLPATDPGTPQRTRGGSRNSWFSLAFLWLIYALNANSRQMIFFVLPAIIVAFKVGPNEVGLLTGSVTFATALIAVPAMLWADRGGRGWRRKYRHLPIVVGYALTTFLTGLNFLTATLGGLLVLQLISHAIAGAGEAVEVTSAAEWWPQRRRGLALGMHHTGFPWGTLLGGLAVAGLLSTYGSSNWRLPYLLYPIPLAVVFAGYWWFATRQRYESVAELTKTADEPAPADAAVDAEPAAPAAPAGGALLRCLAKPNIVLAALLGLFATVAYIGLSVWLPQYLAFVAKYNVAQSAAYSVLFTITGGLGMIAWGWVSDRLGRKLSLMIVFLWLAVGFCLFKNAGVSLGWLIGVQLFAGLAINAPYTLVYAIAMDSAEADTYGVTTSIVDVGLAVGGGLGPILVGFLVGLGGGFKQVAGYNTALYVIAGMMVLAALITALFTRETTGWFRQRDRAVVGARSLPAPEVVPQQAG